MFVVHRLKFFKYLNGSFYKLYTSSSSSTSHKNTNTTMINKKEVLSLKRFMLRSQVLQLYKRYLKLGKLIEESNQDPLLRQEWTVWVRSEFRMRTNETDEDTIKNLLMIGKRQLGELERTIRLAAS